MVKIFVSIAIGLFCLFLFVAIRCTLIHKAYNLNKISLFILSFIPLIAYIIILTIIMVLKKINEASLATPERVAIGISIFELIVGYISECIIIRKEQPLPTVYFNELIIKRPTFDQSDESYNADFVFYDNKPIITGKHNLIVKEIRIYIVLIEEIFNNDELFLKYKENQQYVRSFVVTDKDCFKSDSTNQNFKLTVSLKKDKNHYLTMYLQDDVEKFLDKSMVRFELSYETYKSYFDPINHILEKIIRDMDRFKFTSNKFKAVPTNDTHCNGIKYISNI